MLRLSFAQIFSKFWIKDFPPPSIAITNPANTGGGLLKRGAFSYLALGCIVSAALAVSAEAAELKVLKSGLGAGTISSSPAGISCGGDCDQLYANAVTVTLTATPAAGSVFSGWAMDPDADTSTTPDCTGSGATCTMSMAVARSVRPVFSPATPIPQLGGFTSADIQAYLTANPSVTTPGTFIAALPDEFKKNWIMMTRSESLQTGTADIPRILMPSQNAEFTFTVGMALHSSYPGSHPNAIEYMQWDATEKNFRFHEIVLDGIPAIGAVPARTRGVKADDEKCTKCHSTRNIENPGTLPGTTGITPGLLKAKNKPNWDTYDSWGGMLGFNRDRIYEGSVEAAAFRKLLNPWTWQNDPASREVIEQLRLQRTPDYPGDDEIVRLRGGANDGHVKFAFDPATPVTTEPAPSGSANINVTYSFNGAAGTPPGSNVVRDGDFVTLNHTSAIGSDEGRGVNYFDHLGGLDGDLNQIRVADELIDHRFATGSFPNMVVDVRPIALAISRNCLSVNTATNSIQSTPGLTIDMSFFDARNGLTINDLVADTRSRAQSLTRRKADIQATNLNRAGDLYTSGGPVDGLIQEFGANTSAGASTATSRIRQEVFRRALGGFDGDSTVMGSIYVDRELYTFNTNRVAMYRYFLEPLGVSVDKWSMGVRGRSRTYSFADIFGTYSNVFNTELSASITSDPRGLSLSNPLDCAQLIPAVNATLGTLPAANDVPTYTDIQRIFNKSCIECHGGLEYPPYSNYGSGLDLSEDKNHTAPNDRLDRSHGIALTRINATPATSFLFQRITDTDEACPFGMMPCEGPALSQSDIETVRRWIQGGGMNSRGDPHIRTVSGQNYDFQAAGEFTLLKGQGFELQVRQTPVTTAGPLGPNRHTGLTSCVSVNTAAAARIGNDRISIIGSLEKEPNREGMEIRVNGKLIKLGNQGVNLPDGGRILRTSGNNGLKIVQPGGGEIQITPRFWDHHQMWLLNINASNARASAGLAGKIPKGNWLPAMPDGNLLGRRPSDLNERYKILYHKFGSEWRVKKDQSLFDYAPGQSTHNFTNKEWPLGHEPDKCVLPDTKDPLEPIDIDKAKEICSPLKDPVDLFNCMQDVAVTGDEIFAKLYLAEQEVLAFKAPDAPQLVEPKRFAEGLEFGPRFVWEPAKQREDEKGREVIVRYRHCLWSADEAFHQGRHCQLTEEEGLNFRADKKLEKPGIYFWKIIAEDNRGGVTQSETRRFETARK